MDIKKWKFIKLHVLLNWI